MKDKKRMSQNNRNLCIKFIDIVIIKSYNLVANYLQFYGVEDMA